jgi:2'-deoxymugineic-acid 2'-dioxygenase/mugineic-acid 3-dioxygenase
VQVINHGVSEQVMRDMAAVGEEFFRLPAADKVEFFSEDATKPTRLFSGTTYETGGERYWRDCLRFAYDFPTGNSTKEQGLA